jgi:hypothetical protein
LMSSWCLRSQAWLLFGNCWRQRWWLVSKPGHSKVVLLPAAKKLLARDVHKPMLNYLFFLLSNNSSIYSSHTLAMLLVRK